MARLDAISSATPVGSTARLQGRLAAAQRAAAQAQGEVTALRQELRVAERDSDQKQADVQSLTQQSRSQTPAQTASSAQNQGRAARESASAAPTTQSLLAGVNRAEFSQFQAMAYSRYGTLVPPYTSSTTTPVVSVRV